MILGVSSCFFFIGLTLLWASSGAGKATNSSRLLKIVKYTSQAFELKGFEVPDSSSIEREGVFGDVFPQFQNINAYIFEYREGRRILGDELLLWDTKSWKFPQQDVSLCIKYPEETKPNGKKYYVTKFQAFISQDSKKSHGFLLSGGSGESSIELEFLAKNAKYMSYDVRIFGIQTDLVRNHTDVFGDPY